MYNRQGSKNSGPIDFVTLDNGGNGYNTKWLFINQPQRPMRATDTPKYKVVFLLTEEEANGIMNILSSYNDKLMELFPNHQLKNDYMKPDKDRDGNPTGLYNFTLTNLYQPKLYDANNNKLDPNMYEVYSSSRVAVNFGILPFSLAGIAGIATSRLYAVKVIEWAKPNRTSAFGESVSNELAVPEWAKKQAQQPNVQPQVQQPVQQPNIPQPQVQQPMPQPQVQQQSVNPFAKTNNVQAANPNPFAKNNNNQTTQQQVKNPFIR